MSRLARLSVTQARRHLVAPLLGASGDTRFERDWLAAQLMAEIRDRQGREVLADLNEQGIACAPIKGFAYGRLYPDDAMRPMSDIDILVKHDQFQQAQRCLRRLGFWRAHARLGPSHARPFKRQGLAIDLHTSIVKRQRGQIALRGVWSRYKTRDGLDVVDLATFHMLHIARHDFYVPLINYVDVGILTKHADPAAIIERGNSWRVGRMVKAAMACAERVWQEPSSRQVAEIMNDTPPNVLRRTSSKLRMAESPIDAISLLWLGLQTRSQTARALSHTLKKLTSKSQEN